MTSSRLLLFLTLCLNINLKAQIQEPFSDIYSCLNRQANILTTNSYVKKGDLDPQEKAEIRTTKYYFDGLNRISHAENVPGYPSLQFKYYNDTTCEINYTSSGNKIKDVYISNSKKRILQHTSWQNGIIQKKEFASYNNLDSLIEYKVYGIDGKIQNIISNKYNASNRIIEKLISTNYGEYYRYKYEYDNIGLSKIIEEDINGILVSVTTYKYNDKNLLTEIFTTPHRPYSFYTKKSYIYENNLLVTKEECFSRNNDVFLNDKRTYFKYDNKKNIIEMVVLNYYDGEYRGKEREYYTYDSEGKISLTDSYFENTSDVYRKTRTSIGYDINGSIIKRTFIYADDAKSVKLPFELLNQNIYENIISYR